MDVLVFDRDLVECLFKVDISSNGESSGSTFYVRLEIVENFGCCQCRPH